MNLPNAVKAKLLKLKSNTPFVVSPEYGQILTTLHGYRTVQIKHYIRYKQPLFISYPGKTVHVFGLQSQGYGAALPGEQALFHLERYQEEYPRFSDISGLLKRDCSQPQRLLYARLSGPEQSATCTKGPLSFPVLPFDEFRENTTDGKYAFMVVYPIGKKILEILPSRRLSQVYYFFARLSIKERNKVKFIVIDLWKPYEKVIRKLFPYATLVADKFHYLLNSRPSVLS